jgi:hypothetical protein
VQRLPRLHQPIAPWQTHATGMIGRSINAGPTIMAEPAIGLRLAAMPGGDPWQ